MSQLGVKVQLVGKNTHLDGLQALRGIAAILVFLQHVFWLASYFAEGPLATINAYMLGGSGVFLFFSLSGFLMMNQLDTSVGRFITDRIRRIYPGWLVAILLSGSALALFGYSAWPKLTTVLLLPVGISDQIYIPYWTLIYELQFYIVILLLGRSPDQWRFPFFISWSVVVIAFNLASIPEPSQAAYPSADTIFLSFYNLYFLAGVFAWYSLQRFKPSSNEFGFSISCLVLFSLMHAWFGLRVVYYYSMVFVVFLFVRSLVFVTRESLWWRFLIWFGGLSYGFYLLHITAGFIVVLILKQVLGVSMSYWPACGVIFIMAGILSCGFGFLELKLQMVLKFLIHRFNSR